MNSLLMMAAVVLVGAGGAGQSVIDLKEGWRFGPDPQGVGVSQGWSQDTFTDDQWPTLDAGRVWEEQGYPGLDGYAWYRKRVDVPAEWANRPVWLVLGGVNDAYVLFCNGKRAAAFGDEGANSVYDTPTVFDLSTHLEFGKANLIAIRVLDWSGNGGLCRLPCFLTADAAQLPNAPIVMAHLADEDREILAELQLRGLPSDRPDGTLKVSLFRQGQSKPFATQVRRISPEQLQDVAIFSIPRGGKRDVVWRVQAAAADEAGRPFGNPSSCAETTQLAPRRWPAPYDKLKVLNNCVTELLSTRIGRDGELSREFLNPRDGWVFLSVAPRSGTAEASSASVFLDSCPDSLCLRVNPETGTREAMRHLKEGKHQIQVKGAKGADLVVRAVPFLGYTAYPCSAPVPEMGNYDWAFMEKYVLPNVNAIIASIPVPEEDFGQWVREGRMWMARGGLPSSQVQTTPAPESVVENWAATPGVMEPGYGALIVDEFVTGTPDQYAAWKGAVRLLHADPRFGGKTFIGYCGLRGPVLEPQTLGFYGSFLGSGDQIALERYLEEQPTPDAARLYLLREIQYYHRAWEEALPGFGGCLIMNLGFVSMPPLNCNANPEVNYKVYLEMQLRMLALDPQFRGLYGVQEWIPFFADEEYVRWSYRLFRHYFIEGARERLSTDPYMLPHLRNPEFKEGLDGWRAEPARPDSLAAKQSEDFGLLQGRNLPEVPRTRTGDSFLWMKRSPGRPNRVTQTIEALEPGRVYSLKAFSADLGALDKQQKLAIAFGIDGADVLPEGTFQAECPSYSIFGTLGGYDGAHPIRLNYHRVLFRAKRSTAELSISDWAQPDGPGGPIGQELAVNFIEVEPYLMR